VIKINQYEKSERTFSEFMIDHFKKISLDLVVFMLILETITRLEIYFD